MYIDQLERLNQVLRKKEPELMNWKDIIFHHDSARGHTSKNILEKLRQLKWEVLLQPAYSPDIASSHYHLFRSLQNFLPEKHFTNEECIKNALYEFFDSDKSREFYNREIKMVPERWAQVVESNGDYIAD